MRKFLAFLLILALSLELASAATFPWRRTKAIKACVKSRKCSKKGRKAVCGVSPDGNVWGFPNRCYYACVNYAAGDTWTIDHWYTPAKKCYKSWDLGCSAC